MGAPPTFEKINAGCTENERERDDYNHSEEELDGYILIFSFFKKHTNSLLMIKE
jgi:hypothetical protein